MQNAIWRRPAEKQVFPLKKTGVLFVINKQIISHCGAIIDETKRRIPT